MPSETFKLPKEIERCGSRNEAALGMSLLTSKLIIVVSQEKRHVALFQKGKVDVCATKQYLHDRLYGAYAYESEFSVRS